VYKYKLQITEYAEQDLEEIGDYIANQLKNYDSAVNMVRGLRGEINTLSIAPERHELDEDDMLAGIGVRKHYYKNYKIYYMVYEPNDAVIILRILHMLVDSKAKIYRLFGV